MLELVLTHRKASQVFQRHIEVLGQRGVDGLCSAGCRMRKGHAAQMKRRPSDEWPFRLILLGFVVAFQLGQENASPAAIRIRHHWNSRVTQVSDDLS